MNTQDFRLNLQEILGANAEYLHLQNNSKIPTGSYLPGERNRLRNIPLKGNYGIIPVRKLFVIDFDTHRPDSSGLKAQMDFFSEFLEVDLTKTLNVVTRNGGRHVYLKFPWSVQNEMARKIPKASLRPYSKEFSEILGKEINIDADIRSGFSNCYVVAPTSKIIDSKGIEREYRVYSKQLKILNPISISQQAVKRLSKVYYLHKEHKTREKKEIIELSNIVLKVPVDSKNKIAKKEKLPKKEVLDRIKLKIQSLDSYHSKRAFVKSALHCCYSDSVIAEVCKILKVNKDSFTNMEMDDIVLYDDIHNFHPLENFHGAYCDVGLKFLDNKLKNYSEVKKMKNLEIRRKRIISGKSSLPAGVKPFRYHRVLDIPRILYVLRSSSSRNRDNQRIKDAFSIVENFLNPLANSGAVYMLLSRSELSKVCDMSVSRVADSMRLLRAKKIIILKSRQRTGIAPTYDVPLRWNHPGMTKSLNFLWNTKKESLVFDWRSHAFIDVFNGNIVSESFIAKKNVNIVYPESFFNILDVPQRYLKIQKEKLENF